MPSNQPPFSPGCTFWNYKCNFWHRQRFSHRLTNAGLQPASCRKKQLATDPEDSWQVAADSKKRINHKQNPSPQRSQREMTETKDGLRSQWGAGGNKDKLAYPCHQALPTRPDDTSSGPLLRRAPWATLGSTQCYLSYPVHPVDPVEWIQFLSLFLRAFVFSWF